MQKSAGWILSDVCQILHMHYSSLLARGNYNSTNWTEVLWWCW